MIRSKSIKKQSIQQTYQQLNKSKQTDKQSNFKSEIEYNETNHIHHHIKLQAFNDNTNQNYHTHSVSAVITIQKWLRGVQSRFKSKKMARNYYKRKRVIQELISTQQNYIYDLSLIVADFRMKLRAQKIIHETDSNIIFRNINEIRHLHQQFYAAIHNNTLNYTHYKVIFQPIRKQINFFKIYFEYVSNYQQSSNKIHILKKSQPSFQSFCRSIANNSKYHLLSMQDYIIKPVQRLPKYVLLFKELKKLTDHEHPDYNNICQVLDRFEEVNNSNNEKLNGIVNSCRLIEIQRVLKLNHNIIVPTAKLIQEETVTILTHDNRPISATIRQLKKIEKLVTCIPITLGTKITSIQMFPYENIFAVQSIDGDICALIGQSQDEKYQLMKIIQQQINQVQKGNIFKKKYSTNQLQEEDVMSTIDRVNLAPQVTILGTEERNSMLFKYIIYIIEVKVKQIKFKIFMRFSQALAIQQQVMVSFPNMKIKQSLLKSSWKFNNQNNNIEERKIGLQRFIRELLSKQKIIKEGKKVLNKMGLPQNLYSLPDKCNHFQSHIKSNHSQRSTKSSKREKSAHFLRFSIFGEIITEQKEQEQFQRRQKNLLTLQVILEANQIALGHFPNIFETQMIPTLVTHHLQIFIPWVLSQNMTRKMIVETNLGDRVMMLMQKVALMMNLKCYKDLRLFIEHKKCVERLLQDYELLQNIMEQLEKGDSRIILKKVIYLSHQIEHKQMHNDRVRLLLLTGQYIYQIHCNKYCLGYKQLLFISVLIGIIRHHSQLEIEKPSNIPKIAMETRDIVSNKYVQFIDKTGTWIKDYLILFDKTYKSICNIIMENKQQVKTDSRYSHEEEHISTNICQLSCMCLIKEIYKVQLFGCMVYNAQISHQLQLYLQDIHQTQLNLQCYIVVSQSHFNIYEIKERQKLLEIDLNQIDQIEAHCNRIVIIRKHREPQRIKCNTKLSYSIREMVLYYQMLSKVQDKLINQPEYHQSIMDIRHKGFEYQQVQL